MSIPVREDDVQRPTMLQKTKDSKVIMAMIGKAFSMKSDHAGSSAALASGPPAESIRGTRAGVLILAVDLACQLVREALRR